MRRLHIGKRVPKGYRELPGASHLGQGVWIFPIEPINAAPQVPGEATTPTRAADAEVAETGRGARLHPPSDGREAGPTDVLDTGAATSATTAGCADCSPADAAPTRKQR